MDFIDGSYDPSTRVPEESMYSLLCFSDFSSLFIISDKSPSQVAGGTFLETNVATLDNTQKHTPACK